MQGVIGSAVCSHAEVHATSIEALLSVLAPVVAIVASTAVVCYWLGWKVSEVNGRLSRLEGAFRAFAESPYLCSKQKAFQRLLRPSCSEAP